MRSLYIFFFLFPVFAIAQSQVTISDGTLIGNQGSSGIRSYKGIPYAAPPVGDFRWRDPQPVTPWKGKRDARNFGAKAMQLPLYSDMVFRSNGMSEDCLFLNVWTPATNSNAKLPVLVYFYGGGFGAGDGSEPRYDGESMAKKGIVVVTVNYRLSIFGFFAHPELVKESPTYSAGNYGLMDQHAAIVWVQKNIQAFGGDPKHITIGGESAGARSVSAQMATPLSKGLFVGAIGESGSTIGPRIPTLDEASQKGLEFAQGKTLKQLRAIPAEALLQMTKGKSFGLITDGHFFPTPPIDIYTKGLQMDIPLLAGWNSGEDTAGSAYNTWKWIDLHSKTNGFPVYRYFFAYPSTGAPHAFEIPYALGNLPADAERDAWKISAFFQQYLANFIKTGNPNGDGLPQWYGLQSSIPKVMNFDSTAHSAPERSNKYYLMMDARNGNMK